jgi:hypothetical protein
MCLFFCSEPINSVPSASCCFSACFWLFKKSISNEVQMEKNL